MEKLHLVSSNLKTGWSINFPIEKTCAPTELCRKICYARKGRLNMSMSLNRQQKVYKVFQKENPKDLAREIGDGYRRRGLTFLRWAGSGDMNPSAIRVLNIIARDYPDTIHWVVTRIPSMVAKIADLPNIFLMFSLDGTKSSLTRKKLVDKTGHSRLYYSYLRQKAGEDTMGASIIFNLQQKKKELPFDGPTVCPVDAGAIKTEKACETCRKCFSPRVYGSKNKS